MTFAIAKPASERVLTRLYLCSGSVAFCVHPHPHTQDAKLKRKRIDTYFRRPGRNKQGRILRNYEQSASGISFKSQFLYLVVYVSRYLGTSVTRPGEETETADERTWARPVMDRPDQEPVEHLLQDCLHRRAIIHCLLDARRLQAHARSESRYVQGGIFAGWSAGLGDCVAASL